MSTFSICFIQRISFLIECILVAGIEFKAKINYNMNETMKLSKFLPKKRRQTLILALRVDINMSIL